MKRTFLLQDCGCEAVEHLLILNTDASTEEIQEYIYEVKDKWYAFQDGKIDEEELYYYACEGEYIIVMVEEQYNGECIGYDDVLEY